LTLTIGVATKVHSAKSGDCDLVDRESPLLQAAGIVTATAPNIAATQLRRRGSRTEPCLTTALRRRASTSVAGINKVPRNFFNVDTSRSSSTAARDARGSCVADNLVIGEGTSSSEHFRLAPARKALRTCVVEAGTTGRDLSV
jgi:hypothetical protein